MSNKPTILNANFYNNGGVNFGLLYDNKTGNFIIKQRDILGKFDLPGLATLYENGEWKRDAFRINELFEYSQGDLTQSNPIATNKAKDLNTLARKQTYAAYQTQGGKNSGLKINSAALPENQNEQASINNVSSSTGGGTGGIGPLGNFPSVPNPALNKTLVYPEDLIQNQQDTLQITQIEYQSPYKDLFTPGGQTVESIFQSGLKRGTAIKNKLEGRVILPMPNAMADSNSVNWGQDEMNALTAAATSTIGRNLGPAVGAQLLAKLAQEFGVKGASDIPRLGLLGKLLLQAGTGGPESEAAVRAAIQSYTLNRYGFEVSPESILSRGFGVVPNTNVQLLFQNVKLRGFTFQYIMSPRSKEEATTVNYILRWFKQGMAAKKRSLQAGTGALLLGTPNIFKLEYKSGNSSIKGVNKFKLCALTNFDVNYTPNNKWIAYDEGQPAAVGMSMSFKEIEPIYDKDYQTPADNPDNPPVADDEIGF